MSNLQLETYIWGCWSTGHHFIVTYYVYHFLWYRVLAMIFHHKADSAYGRKYGDLRDDPY